MRIKWGRAEWKNAGLTALAVCVCQGIVMALGLKTGYWATITCVVVMQSEVGGTLVASRDRLLGTAIGALAGWVAVLAWNGRSGVMDVVVLGAAVYVATAMCNVLDLKSSGRLAGVTVIIVFLLHGAEAAWRAAGSRFLEVSLGVVVALVVTGIFFPKSLWMGLTAAR